MAVCTTEIHVGDIGTELRLRIVDGCGVPVDISSATTLEICVKTPSGGVKTFTASETTDGTDGRLSYITVMDDLDEDGTWEIQAHVITPSSEFRSQIQTFVVKPNICA